MSAQRLWAVRAGLIRTLDPARPEVSCLAVRGRAIEAAGTREEVRAVVGPNVEWVDLRPAVVLPGLSDSHIHLVEWALGRGQPDISTAASMKDALLAVARAARSSARAGWLEIKGWNPAWRAEASLAELDAVTEDRAVALIAHDLHSGWLNSEALTRLDVGPGRPDPQGGFVERDSGGKPTGVLKERALSWWYEARPRPGAAECKGAVREAQTALHRLGVTAVHSVEAPEAFCVVQDLERSHELRLRVLHHMPRRYLDALIECGISSGFGGEWLRIGGIKVFTDGALGSRTAWMLQPYEDTGECGIPRLEPDEFRADIERASRAGLAATVHAIGDAAVRMTLDCLEDAGADGLAIPHRIEHLQCVHQADLGRAGKAGIVASMQPSHMLTDIPLAELGWGSERSRGAFAFRSLLGAGTVLAFGSDAPVEAADPREGFYAARARRDRGGYPEDGWFPEERLSGAEVLEAYAVGPARAAGDADRRGRLSPGFAADFAAWDTDLVTAEPDRLFSAGVISCVVNGEIVYSS